MNLLSLLNLASGISRLAPPPVPLSQLELIPYGDVSFQWGLPTGLGYTFPLPIRQEVSMSNQDSFLRESSTVAMVSTKLVVSQERRSRIPGSRIWILIAPLYRCGSDTSMIEVSIKGNLQPVDLKYVTQLSGCRQGLLAPG